MEKIKCIGCGAIIQTTDENAPGYLPKSVLEKKDTEDILCKRCFRMKHYNETFQYDKPKEEYTKILEKMKDDPNAMVLYIVDLLNIEFSFTREISCLLENRPVFVIGTKMDLYPKTVSEEVLREFIIKKGHDSGINIEAIYCTSGLKMNDVDSLVSEIIRFHKPNTNLYFVGYSNVGKSTLVNRILGYYYDTTKQYISTSSASGTTLDFIQIPFDENCDFIDTPGMIHSKNIENFLNRENIDKLHSKNRISPRVFQSNKGQCYIAEGFFKLSFIEGTKNNIVFYIPNEIPIHRTKIEAKNRFDQNPNYKAITLPIKPSLSRYNICINGVGFISVDGNAKFVVETYQGVQVEVVRDVLSY